MQNALVHILMGYIIYWAKDFNERILKRQVLILYIFLSHFQEKGMYNLKHENTEKDLTKMAQFYSLFKSFWISRFTQPLIFVHLVKLRRLD